MKVGRFCTYRYKTQLFGCVYSTLAWLQFVFSVRGEFLLECLLAARRFCFLEVGCKFKVNKLTITRWRLCLASSVSACCSALIHRNQGAFRHELAFRLQKIDKNGTTVISPSLHPLGHLCSLPCNHTKYEE